MLYEDGQSRIKIGALICFQEVPVAASGNKALMKAHKPNCLSPSIMHH